MGQKKNLKEKKVRCDCSETCKDMVTLKVRSRHRKKVLSMQLYARQVEADAAVASHDSSSLLPTPTVILEGMEQNPEHFANSESISFDDYDIKDDDQEIKEGTEESEADELFRSFNNMNLGQFAEEEAMMENGYVCLDLDVPEEEVSYDDSEEDHSEVEHFVPIEARSINDDISHQNNPNLLGNRSILNETNALSDPNVLNALLQKSEEFKIVASEELRNLGSQFNLSRACIDAFLKKFSSASEDIFGIELFPKSIYHLEKDFKHFWSNSVVKKLLCSKCGAIHSILNGKEQQYCSSISYQRNQQVVCKNPLFIESAKKSFILSTVFLTSP